jgi:hypothetical protein
MASRCPRGRGQKTRGRSKNTPEGARSRARARLREKLRRALWGEEGRGFSVQLGHFVDQLRSHHTRKERSASRASLAAGAACGSINASGLTTCGSVVVVPLSDLEDTRSAAREIASRVSKIDAIVLDARGGWIEGREWIAQLLAAHCLLAKAGPVCVIAGPSPSDLSPYDAVPGVRSLITRPTLESAIWAALALADCAPDPPRIH